LSQDPVDPPDGPQTDGAVPTGDKTSAEGAPAVAASVDDALELPPEMGVAEHLERRARLAEDRLAEVLSAYRQFKVENEGFRDRVKRDSERRFDQQREKLLLRFIDIMDNLDRALGAAEQTFAGNPLIEGLILVRIQLLQTLQQEGLERIPVLGLPFNPAFSEAVGTAAVTDPDHDHVVIREELRGYRLNGRVARASRVVVGQYAEGEGGTEASDEHELIGADEALGAAPVEEDEDDAAKTMPLDEQAIQELFGGGEEPDPETK
jgi:molecular chaperone GrpE